MMRYFLLVLLCCMHCGHATRHEMPVRPVRADTPTQDAGSMVDYDRVAVKAQRKKPVITEVGAFPKGVHGMAVDDDGTLFFSDSFGALDKVRQIYRLEPPFDGKPKPTTIQAKLPAGLLFRDGDLFVCDVKAGSVRRFDGGLKLVETWSVPAPWNLAAYGKQMLISVTNKGSVVRLSPGGKVEELASGLDAPFAVAATDSAVWISEQVKEPTSPGRVALWGLDGQTRVVSQHPWKNPEGLAIGPSGDLWVADTELGQLLRVAADGKVEVVATDLGLPVCVTTTPKGDLLVNVSGKNARLLRVELP